MSMNKQILIQFDKKSLKERLFVKKRLDELAKSLPMLLRSEARLRESSGGLHHAEATLLRSEGGGWEIRTPDALSGIQTFQVCALDRYANPPSFLFQNHTLTYHFFVILARFMSLYFLDNLFKSFPHICVFFVVI